MSEYGRWCEPHFWEATILGSQRLYKYGNHLTPGLAEVRSTLRS